MHGIYRVVSVDILGGYCLRVGFDDGSAQAIDLEPILEGELYGPLRLHLNEFWAEGGKVPMPRDL